jgi:hypothetical protein
MIFDTKVAIIVREDLQVWQKLNVTAFLTSGIAGTAKGIMGEPYKDASDGVYLPMLIQPVLVFSGSGDQLRRAFERALSREIQPAIYTQDLFRTGNDIDNRAAVKAVARENLNLVGLGFRAPKKVADKVLDGLLLHK